MKRQYNLRHDTSPALLCTRCDEFFRGKDLYDAEKHANSDAKHLYYHNTGYVKRSKAGVAFYWLFSLGRGFYLYAGAPSSEIDGDERWREKPEYEIYIQDSDGERVLQKVSGQMNARRAYIRRKDELLENEGRLVRKKVLGVTIQKKYKKKEAT